MASVSVGEADLTVVAEAAQAALRCGDREAALSLDRLARRMTAAISGSYLNLSVRAVDWRDIPSTLGDI